MDIEVNKSGKEAIVKIKRNSLSQQTAEDLKALAVELINEGFVDLSLDLSETDFIDSAGVGKLLFLNKKLKTKNGSFKIVEISETLYHFLESLTIDKVITIRAPE